MTAQHRCDPQDGGPVTAARVQELLMPYIDGDGPEDTAAGLAELGDCPGCLRSALVMVSALAVRLLEQVPNAAGALTLALYQAGRDST